MMRKMKCGSSKCCPMVVMLLRKHTSMTFTEISDFTGYNKSTLGNIFGRRYPELKAVRTHKEDVDLEQIAHEYRDLGMTSYELGEKYGVDSATIRRWMRKVGIVMGKDNPRCQEAVRGKGAAILKDRCREHVVKKLVDDGDTLELVEYGEKLTLRCKVCGHVFTRAKGGYIHQFTCPHCYEEYLCRQAEAKDRRKHERQQQLDAAREWRLSVPHICKECGEPFYSEYNNPAYCCDGCKRRASNRKAAERRKRRGDGAGTYRHRMRIKRTPATYDRTVTLGAVYKKFNGRCCQCGCMTYRTRDYAPNQATLDHIVALANNGTHTWDNVQLLCSDCNSMKRDVGQMRLPIAV